MADVFVSYARGDQQLAQRVAEQLTAAGFTVWWDTDLLPHNRFATVIEEQIHVARAVLVVWSEAAATSPWVRAEAELGRAEGKLIQVSVDESTIPLPFNQYQSADLRHWRGNQTDPQWLKVLASVTHFASNGAADASPPMARARTGSATGKPRMANGARKLGLAAVAAIAVAGGGAALLWSSHAHDARGARIAVQPFRTIGGSATLGDFAAGLSDSLQNLLTQDQLQTLSSSEADTMKGDDLAARSKTLGVGLMFSGAVQAKGPDIEVSMRLDDPVQHATLWTAEMSGPAAQLDQLQARVGALTLAVLNCSAQALAPNVRISDAALQAFLHACELSQTAAHGLAGRRQTYAMLDAMRQAAREAPNFAAAHSVLAKHLAFVAAYHLLDQVHPIRQEADNEARRALQLDPKDPDSFVALGLLAPPLDFAKRESFFRQALVSNPGWPHANGFLGNVMTDTGRLQDAASLYQRAASVNQLSNDWATEAAGGLIRIGDTEQADHELARLSQLWPDDAENLSYQLDSMIAQQRWSDATKLLDKTSEFPDDFSRSWIAGWRELLSALQSSNPAARQSVRESLLVSAPTDARHAIYGLALLGFTDDAFSVALHDMRIDATQEDSAGFLFAPEVAPLLRDRRFIALAARFGLVDYWRRTGRWPDFCLKPGLPYSCAQEAVKFAAPS
jgi:TolB-like protein/Tfp pilus assembly protein PilF